MTRLVAFGCSNTFGQGLPDWKRPNPNPSKYAWPQILANKLNLSCCNLAKSGSSNKEIWYNIVNTKFKKDDIVIILWSWYDRYCVLLNEKTLKQIHWNQKTPQATCFLKHLHNEYDMLIDFYLRCNHVQSLLENKIKLVKHIKQKTNTHTSAKLNWNKINFLDVSIIDIMSDYPLALDNLHPGHEAHKRFATMIYNDIC